MGTPQQVWFVTGAGAGLGLATVHAALAAGHRVVATARDTGSLAGITGDDVRCLPLDVTDRASIRAAVDTALGEFGRIDVLVNNAGYTARGAIEELSDVELRSQFDTNVLGLLDVTRAVLPAMRAQRSGHILQLSSVGGVAPALGGAVYGGTKFAVEGVSEVLAGEVAHLGIKVTIVEPGPFRTDFSGRSVRWSEPIEDYTPVLGPVRERFAAMHGKQPGDPDRAARAMVAVAALADPPLRLPLGANAFARIRERLGERLAELDELEVLGLDTDFPE